MKNTPAAKACPEGNEYEVLMPNSMSRAGGRGLPMANFTKVLVKATSPIDSARSNGRQTSRRKIPQASESTTTITVNHKGFAIVVMTPSITVKNGTR